MKNWIKNGLLMIAVGLSLVSCGLFRKAPTTPENYGLSMRILYDREFTRAQFDSICVADAIPMNLEQWKAYTSRDYETNNIITEYMFIKALEANGEVIYRLMIVDEDTYNIYKRITYGNKEK